MSDIDVGEVGMIPIESVMVEDRTREIMGDLDSLEANIRSTGLIAPLAVMKNDDGTYRLLAGERRFTVLKRNNVTVIPARIYDRELTELEMKVIEKSENFHRKEMEYWELDKLTLDIHRMEQQIHGTKAPGPGQTGWGTEDTGEMLGGVSKATISMSLKRAQARENMPELFESCKTAADATTLLKKMDEALLKQTIAQKVEAEAKGDNKALAKLAKAYILKDFFEGIKDVPAGVFHLVEIDPPYGIDLKKAKRKEGESQYTLEDYNEIDSEAYPTFLAKLFAECYRVMAEHSWLICWFGPEPWFELVYRLLIETGFETRRMCGIWAKPSGQTKRPEIHLPNAYEMFFYARKGEPAIAKPRGSNIFNYSPVVPQNKTHPTERPLELTNDIYETFAFPGSRVLIPFLGSGNGLISAYKLGMTAIGFDLGKGYRDSFLVKANALQEGK